MQSIADGYMGRCEMVWTTAGTNRVCGRCMALKDTVVGHTDESGVTIPPLHPRVYRRQMNFSWSDGNVRKCSY